jgi:hypothetical protein
MKSLVLALVLACCSCSTKTTVTPQGDTVNSGYGVRTIVTFHPDGRKTIETIPINPIEAAVGGAASAIARAFLLSKPAEK